MKKNIFIILLMFLLMFFIALMGCTNSDTIKDRNGEGVSKITAEAAKKRLDKEKDIILVDVRTPEEYKEEHIKNAILLPLDMIDEKADEVIPDKEAVYFVYCRSGNRSATAAKKLVEMGYKHIFDLGGIIDWTYEKQSGL